MPHDPEFRVYISSTLDDMKEEREIARKVISELGVVTHSYRASEEGSVDTCTKDVRRSHLYVGILGQRYGWVPGGEAKTKAKSITELEYEACAVPGLSPIKRVIFVRRKNLDHFTDALKHHPTAKRMAAFLKRASTEQQPFQYETPHDFEMELHKAVALKRQEFHRENAPGQPIFDQRKVWQTSLKPVVVLALPGSDDELRNILTGGAPTFFCDAEVSPSSADLAVDIDKGVRKAQLACLLVTNATLQRIKEPAVLPRFTRLVKTLLRRNGHAPVLCVDVDPGALPAAWRSVLPLEIAASSLRHSPETTANQLYQHLRARAPLTTQTRIAVPFLVIAPTRAEIETLIKGDAAFAGFRDADTRKQRRSQFEQLKKAASANHPQWPKNRYDTARERWRSFGHQSSTVDDIVRGVVATINTAPPGSRERELLQEAELVVRRYDIDEYLTDVDGSRRAIQDISERGCLMVVDETALLHPKLRDAAETLLASRRSAVVSVSPCDPAHWPTNRLLGEASFLRVGAIVQRFKTDQDSQCELALNSEERVRRWLRLAVPRLVVEMEGLASHPALVSRIDEHLK